MKNRLITLIAILCLLTTVKAQTFTGAYEGMYFGSIPSIFTQSGHPYLVAIRGVGSLSVLDGDLNVLADVNNDDNYICEAYYMDADATSITISSFHNTSDHGLLVTQNLFNDDDSFEYLECQKADPNDYHCKIVNIKSSNGSLVQSINADEGYYFADDRTAFVLKIEGNIYLVLRENTSNNSTKHLFYLIKQNHGLLKIDVDLPLSVFPTLPTQEEQITVELGEGNNATEITVVNSMGQVVKHFPVEEGQRTITIPARELGSGLNIINSRSPQGQGSCKIIVR